MRPKFGTRIILVNRLERIQRIFLRMYCYKLCIQYSTIHYHDFCRLAGIHTLQARRNVSDLVFLYKMVNGVIQSEMLSAVYFNAPQRLNSSLAPFKPPRARINLLQHSYKDNTS
jgi:hypothetical protein